jgi:hypothetical protein
MVATTFSIDTPNLVTNFVRAEVFQPISGSLDEAVYEGVRLLTDDPENLVPLVDRLLSFSGGRASRRARHHSRMRRCDGDPVERTQAQGIS